MGSLNMHFILTGIIIFITLVPPPVQGKKTYLIKTQKGDEQKHGKSFLISTVKKGERKGYSKKGRDYETGAEETQNLKARYQDNTKKGVCNEPKGVIGNCKNQITLHTFDKRSHKCLPYYGCKGKGNRFNSREECEKKCASDTVQCGTTKNPCDSCGQKNCKNYGKCTWDEYGEKCVSNIGIIKKSSEVLATTNDLIQQSSYTPEEKKEISKNLKKDVESFVEHGKAGENQRYKKPWVQSTELSDNIADMSRLSGAIMLSLNKTIGSFGHKFGSSNDYSSEDDLLRKAHGMACKNIINRKITCPADDKYRTPDGSCNNLLHPKFGAAGIAMRRFVPPAYADGKFEPRDSPISARLISNEIMKQQAGSPTPPTEKGLQHMVMQFGQFLDHDITLTPESELDCCDETLLKIDQAQPSELQACFNILAKDRKDNPCLPLTRSDFICTKDPLAFREQMNAITAFIDGSNVYGSTNDRIKKLRDLKDGLLKTNKNSDDLILPTGKQCGFQPPKEVREEDELVTGDIRALIQPTLTSMHTLFLTEHNRIAKELKKELERRNSLPSDSGLADELLFQETRKIIGAMLQKITYKDYLPIILGSKAMSAHNLDFSQETDYDQSVDPSILNEFATVAYRFGHSQIANTFHGQAQWPLSFHYFNRVPADGFVRGTNWMDEMRGASTQICPKSDLIMGDGIRNSLLGPKHQEDLAARNIQRGREHGIPPYGILREKCGLAPLGTSKPEEIEQDTWDNLLRVYNSPADIDAFVGGLAEVAPADGVVGPLFACIIGEQFKNLMVGDRYFFTHSDQNNARGLGVKTKEALLGRTSAHIICDNTIDNKPIPENVFKATDSANNKNVKCTEVPRINIEGIVQDILGETSTTTTTTTTTASTTTTDQTSTSGINITNLLSDLFVPLMPPIKSPIPGIGLAWGG